MLKSVFVLIILNGLLIAGNIQKRIIPESCKIDFNNRVQICKELASQIASNIENRCYNTVIWYRMKPQYPTWEYTSVEDYLMCKYLDKIQVEQILSKRIKFYLE